MKAAPGQQGWQNAAVARKDGGLCRCNSNSNDCQEEESPGRDKHHQEERGGRQERKEEEEEEGLRDNKRETDIDMGACNCGVCEAKVENVYIKIQTVRERQADTE